MSTYYKLVNTTNGLLLNVQAFLAYLFFSCLSIFTPKVERIALDANSTERYLRFRLLADLPSTETEQLAEAKLLLDYLTKHPDLEDFIVKVGNTYHLPQPRYNWEVLPEYRLLARFTERLARLLEITYVDEFNQLKTTQRSLLLDYSNNLIYGLDLAVLDKDRLGNLSYSLKLIMRKGDYRYKVVELEFGRAYDVVLGV